MKIKSISASSYELFSWCQWKYFLQYQLNFDDPSGASATIGHIAHSFLEILSRASIIKHDKNSKIWNPDYLWNVCFNHYYNDAVEAENIKNDKLKKVCIGVKELLNSPYTPIRDNTICAEKAFFIPLEEPRFKLKYYDDKHLGVSGKIDRIDQLNPETLEIIDYKTGTRDIIGSKDKRKKDSEYLHGEIQPRLYHMAATQLYPHIKNFLVTFVYLADGGPVTVPFSQRDIADTKDMVFKRFKTIEANDDPIKNKTDWRCKYMCPHFKTGNCEAVWAEKDQLGIPFVLDKYTVLNIRKRQ